MRGRAGVAVVGAVLVASVVSSCDGGGGGDGRSSDPSSAASSDAGGPAGLPVLWSVSVDQAPFQTERPLPTDNTTNEGPNPVDAGERTVVVGERGVRGIDTGTGSVAWTLDLDDPVCATAPRANASGVAAVLTSAAGDGACTDAVAIDTTDGTELWTARLPRADGASGHEVTVGPDSVVSAGRCNGFTVFAASTGAVVADVPGADEGTVCDSAASDGSQVVLQRGRQVLLFDAATGERTSQLRVDGLGRVGDVVSSDPLVVTAIVGGEGRLVNLSVDSPLVFGRASNSFAGVPEATASAGGVLWMQYDDQPERLWGYDPTTGAETASVDIGDSWLVGVLDDRLVLSTAVVVDGTDRSELRLLDPDRPDQPETVGLLPEPVPGDQGLSSGAVVGDVLVRIRLAESGGRAEAVRIVGGGAAGAGAA